MNIEIVTATNEPLHVISMAAGTSYGKSDYSEKRVRTCFENGHMSVFEHASFTVRIEGISRACSHQLVRHRMASFVQQSQRYTKIDTDTDWFVKPRSFKGINEEDFLQQMWNCACAYRAAIENGIKPEDARYLLPEATKTCITMTMNCRELFHFLDLRLDKAAQWEIKNLANEIACVLCADRQWGYLVNLWLDAKKSKGKHVKAGE